MCEQVSVGVCDWGWFTPAESHYRGLYQILSRCLPCQILAVFAVFGSTFTVRFLFWFRDSWALLLSWTPIAGDSSAHCFPALPASAYEELYFSFSHCITSCNKLSLFRNWILPSSLWHYLKRCKSRAAKIIKDSNHPGNHHFCLLPSGRRYRSMLAKTERLRRSFFPQAIRLLNSVS